MLDIIITVVIVVSALLGLWRGMIAELGAIGGWVIAGLVAFSGYERVSNWLKTFEIVYLENDTIRAIAAGLLIFIVFVIVLSIVVALFRALIHKTGLGGTDLFLGFVFGILRGLFIVVLVIWGLQNYTSATQKDWYQESIIIPHLDFAIDYVDQTISDNKDIIEQHLPIKE